MSEERESAEASSSRRIGGLIGPALMAMIASESPLVQPHLYDEQIPPVVYLSGVLSFVAGLATVRVHNVWERSWRVLITLVGWGAIALGLLRMFSANAYRSGFAQTSVAALMVLEGVLFLVGCVITFESYRPARRISKPKVCTP